MLLRPQLSISQEWNIVSEAKTIDPGSGLHQHMPMSKPPPASCWIAAETEHNPGWSQAASQTNWTFRHLRRHRPHSTLTCTSSLTGGWLCSRTRDASSVGTDPSSKRCQRHSESSYPCNFKETIFVWSQNEPSQFPTFLPSRELGLHSHFQPPLSITNPWALAHAVHERQ